MNIAELIMELADLVTEPFDQGEFVFEFMKVFNPPKATLTRLRKAANDKPDPGSDLLWPRKMHFRVAAPGQTAEVIDALKQQKVAKNKAPRFLISTDGKEFSALDTKIDEPLHCDFDKLDEYIDFFLPLAGIDKFEAVEENPADIKAAGRLSKLYDEIIRINPDWDTPEKRHALNQFMTRLLFCMFAEDTGSFEKDLFIKTITEFGGADGEQLQVLLKQVFDVMNVPETERGEILPHINAFPWVNGGLFAEQTEAPKLNKRAKRVMIEAASLKWQEINPDIFGSMIQAVVDEKMRGDLGMHYTSVPNIMKVLQPLFLMSLEEEFERVRDHREERSILNKLLTRITKIRVFDPACGSGNFLIIAYRELRKLEMKVFKRLDKISGGTTTWRVGSGVKLSSFYGIELADFAAETAKLSLWIAEYQMNQRFKETFGEAPKPFPLQEGGHIVCDNALRLDWQEVCPKPDDEEVETYICGNPPYQGSKFQSKKQKEEMTLIFDGTAKNYKNLDYVAAWYFSAVKFAGIVRSQAAFVATNSICQGEQVALLWPLVFERKMEIGFAHRSFMWKNLAAKNAAVSCVIVGIRSISNVQKTLFDGPIARQVKHIGPYLIEMPDIIVRKAPQPLNNLPQMNYGNMTVDGGHLILSPTERHKLLENHPEAAPLVRRLYGAQELVKGIERYCLWIDDQDLPLALTIPTIQDRINACKQMRLDSKRDATKELSDSAHRFGFISGEHTNHTIITPRLTTTTRPYIQVGILNAHEVPNDQVYSLCDASMYIFSILSSWLHITWIKSGTYNLMLTNRSRIPIFKG